MRLDLWLKLFAAFVVMTGVALAGMTWALNRNLDRGLLAYAREVESRQVDELADALVSAYQQSGDWRFLDRAPETLRRQLGIALRPATGPRRGEGQHPVREPGNREAGRGRPEHRPPPPTDREGPPPPQRGPRRGPPPPMDGPLGEPMALHTRLAVADAQNRLLAGAREALSQGQPRSLILEGVVIGGLFALPLPALESDLDLAFAARQREGALIVGGLILLLSALAALLLAKGMVRPIHRLADAAQQLTGGRFDIRVAGDGGDELGHLARDFNRLAVTLERNRASQQDWLANVAHELRTPVAVLRGELLALQDGIRALDSNALESLDAEVVRLSVLIEDLHQLSLSDAGGLRYQMKRCDLRDLVSDAVTLASVPDEVELDLQLADHAVPVRVDPNRLDQLLSNLMQNSIRYSDRPSKIQIQVTTQAGQGLIRWNDSPPGVPESERSRIFERLYRVDSSRAGDAGGAGLGLAICAQVVAAHEGAIEAEESPIGGLSVVIRFPLTKSK
jgi:two-component system sensor histidine kinase BaeS